MTHQHHQQPETIIDRQQRTSIITLPCSLLYQHTLSHCSDAATWKKCTIFDPRSAFVPTSTLQNKDVGGYLIRAFLTSPLSLRRFKATSYVFLHLLTTYRECVMPSLTPATHLKHSCLFFAQAATNVHEHTIPASHRTPPCTAQQKSQFSYRRKNDARFSLKQMRPIQRGYTPLHYLWSTLERNLATPDHLYTNTCNCYPSSIQRSQEGCSKGNFRAQREEDRSEKAKWVSKIQLFAKPLAGAQAWQPPHQNFAARTALDKQR